MAQKDCQGTPKLDGDSVPGYIVITCDDCKMHDVVPKT